MALKGEARDSEWRRDIEEGKVLKELLLKGVFTGAREDKCVSPIQLQQMCASKGPQDPQGARMAS